MKNLIVISFICLGCTTIAFSQSNTEPHTGTIKVQKKGHIVKAVFDDVNYRLVGIDQYGNILDTAILEFEMATTIRGLFHSEKTSSPFLSKTMQEELGRCDRTSKIFFDKIKAKEKDGTIITLPKFQYNFGYRDESND